MIETKVPQDIRKYQTKVIGPLTIRQMVCGVIAIALDILIYYFILSVIDVTIDQIIFILMLFDACIMLFTFKPNGMNMEKFIYELVMKNFIYPSRRKMITKLNPYKPPVLSEKERKQKMKEQKKNLKAHPELKAYK